MHHALWGIQARELQDAGIIDCTKKFFSVRGGIQAGGVHVGAHVYGVCIIDSSSSAKETINTLFIPQSREDVHQMILFAVLMQRTLILAFGPDAISSNQIC